MLQALLPEVMVNPGLSQQFYAQYVLCIAHLMEQYLRARVEMGDISPVDVPLTVRAAQGMFVGMLVIRILGDEPLLSRWNDMPEVLSQLLFEGLRPRAQEEGI
jgi:hypothetical protein